MCIRESYEAELGVIIGKDAKNVPLEEVKNYIFGYTVINDVSARNVQTSHKQWYFGKSLDGFTPMGPCIVTADEIDVYKRQEVVLPEKIERVVIASVWPLASVYVLSMGTDKLVGLDPAIISAAENSMLINIAPEISEIESGFSQNGIMNAEELIKLDPDVVLYSSGVPEDYEIATQAGIPAVGFSLSIKDYNAVETINSWIELLEDVMGEDISSAEYVEYGLEMQ